jgi:hypothetical protein
MARIILLDSTPLGLACRPRGHTRGDACRRWLDTIRLSGNLVVIPEIADFEVRREMTSPRATPATSHAFRASTPGIGRPSLPDLEPPPEGG